MTCFRGVLVVLAATAWLMGCHDVPARGMSGQREEAAAPRMNAGDPNAAILPRPIPEDQRAMLGERLSLRVPFHDVANDTAFWVEENGRRMLVVMGRDVRSEAQRQQGHPSANPLGVPGIPGSLVISGIVLGVPPAEERYSWGLTSADRANLARLGVYLRADAVNVAGG